MPKKEVQIKAIDRISQKSKKVIPFKKKRKKSKAKVLLFILIAMALMYIMLFTPVFNITSIEVQGNSKYSSKQIIDMSGIITGQNIFKVNYFKVVKDITNHEHDGFIESVSIKRSYPSRVILNISERVPAAYLKLRGQYLIIDKNGVVLEVVNDIKGLNIPEVIGISFDKNYKFGQKLVVADNNIEKLDAAIQCLDNAVQYNLINIMSKIDLNNIDKITAWLNGDKIQVNLCDDIELPYKIKFLATIVKDEKGNYSSCIIDFTSPSKPTVNPKY